MTVQVFPCGAVVFGVFRADDIHDRIEILDVQVIRIFILPIDGTDIVIERPGRDHIVPGDLAAQPVRIVQAELLRRARVEILSLDRAVGVGLDLIVELEIAAVMAKTVIIRVAVLPRPVLREQFAVFIGVGRHKAILFRPVQEKAHDVFLTNGREDIVMDCGTVFMAGNINLDAVVPCAVHLFTPLRAAPTKRSSLFFYYIENGQ